MRTPSFLAVMMTACLSFPCLSTAGGFLTWQILHSGTTKTLRAVHFPSQNTGYAVGEAGTILKTTDAGATWTAQASNTTETLKSVFFTDSQVGYAVGDSGSILKTLNGGENWGVNFTAIYAENRRSLSSIHFTDNYRGFAVGSKGAVLKTVNGGSSWTWPRSSSASYAFTSVQFMDADTGYVVGEGGMVLKTVDGGQNWTFPLTKLTRNLHSVAILPSGPAYVSGDTGTLASNAYWSGYPAWKLSTDGDLGSFREPLLSLQFTTDNHGYVVGGKGSAFYLHPDLTIPSWQYLPPVTDQTLHGVWFQEGETGYAVGGGGVILKCARNPSLGVPVLRTPGSGANFNPATTITMEWEAVAGATFYQVEVSTYQYFSKGSTRFFYPTVTSLSRSILPVANDYNYYWRVKAGNLSGTGDWSAHRIFHPNTPTAIRDAGISFRDGNALPKSGLRAGASWWYSAPGSFQWVDLQGRSNRQNSPGLR